MFLKKKNLLINLLCIVLQEKKKYEKVPGVEMVTRAVGPGEWAKNDTGISSTTFLPFHEFTSSSQDLSSLRTLL